MSHPQKSRDNVMWLNTVILSIISLWLHYVSKSKIIHFLGAKPLLWNKLLNNQKPPSHSLMLCGSATRNLLLLNVLDIVTYISTCTFSYYNTISTSSSFLIVLRSIRTAVTRIFSTKFLLKVRHRKSIIVPALKVLGITKLFCNSLVQKSQRDHI